MSKTHPVKAKPKHEPNYRCAFCHEQVEEEIQAPCGGCGTLLHPECKVNAGGCPTLGCDHDTRVQAGRPRHTRMTANTRAELVGWLSMGCGAGGMVLSLLALASGVTSFTLAGAAGFVAGAVLLVAGLLSFTLVALRGGASPISGTDRRATATLLTRLAGVSGVAGMGFSFLALLGTHAHELTAGGAGFMAGALLVLAGVLGYALLARDDEETTD
jgi:hypothetical protein